METRNLVRALAPYSRTANQKHTSIPAVRTNKPLGI